MCSTGQAAWVKGQKATDPVSRLICNLTQFSLSALSCPNLKTAGLLPARFHCRMKKTKSVKVARVHFLLLSQVTAAAGRETNPDILFPEPLLQVILGDRESLICQRGLVVLLRCCTSTFLFFCQSPFIIPELHTTLKRCV